MSILRRIRWKELLLICLPPIIWTLIMLVPLEYREPLKLQFDGFQIWQLFTWIFVHDDWNHLVNNIGGYLLAAFTCYILATSIHETRRYLRLFTIAILFFIVISSILSMLIIHPYLLPLQKRTMGASGIIAFIFGLIPFLWLKCLYPKKMRLKIVAISLVSFSLFALGDIWAIYYANDSLSIILLFSVLLLLCSVLWNIRYIKKPFSKNISNIRKIPILLLPVIAFITGVILLFPAQIVSKTNSTDIIIHTLGLLSGIILSFLLLYLQNDK